MDERMAHRSLVPSLQFAHLMPPFQQASVGIFQRDRFKTNKAEQGIAANDYRVGVSGEIGVFRRGSHGRI